MTEVAKAVMALRLKGVRWRASTGRLWWEPSDAARQLGVAAITLPTDNAQTAADMARAAQRKAEKTLSRASGSDAAAARQRDSRTLHAVTTAFMTHTRFRDLRPATQGDYRRTFGQIGDIWGGTAVDKFDKPLIETWYQALRAQTSKRNAERLVRGLSILLSHAERLGWRPPNSNPCYRLSMATADPRDRALTDWADFDALVAASTADPATRRPDRPNLRLAVQLALFTGQRQTDVITARVADFSDVVVPDQAGGKPRKRLAWAIVQSKRGKGVVIPIHAEIDPALRAALTAARAAGRDTLLVDDVTGQAWSTNLFGKRWRALLAAAQKTRPHLAGLMFRDLRRSTGMLGRAGGASDADLKDLLGNSLDTNPGLRQTYLPGQLETAARAVDAIKRPPTQPTAKRKDIRA